jgi:hypothetical protein
MHGSFRSILTFAVVVLSGGAAAVAAASTLADTQLELLQQRGYRTPSVVFESSAIKVVSAAKGGKPRLVVLGANDRLVEAGLQGRGKLSVTAPGPAPPSSSGLAPTGYTLVEVSYTTPRTRGGSDTNGTFWVVRDDGTIACKVTGSSSTQLGKACGSSGWTSATPTLSVEPTGEIAFDVRYEMSGLYSTSDGRGGCLKRSPVRSSRTDRWTIQPRGTCKKAKPPLKQPDNSPDL